MTETSPCYIGPSRRVTSRGITLLETALVLPLILAVIMILIWLGITINARTSLDSAMTQAMRLAVTRADEVRSGRSATDLISAYTQFAATNPGVMQSEGIIWKGVDPDRARRYYGRNCPLTWPLDPIPRRFRTQPSQYYYILAYLYTAMQQSVGSSLAFPCSAAVGGLRPPNRDPNACYIPPPSRDNSCVECLFLNADSLLNGSTVLAEDSWTPARAPLPTDRFILRCTYTSSNALLRPIGALLSAFGGNSTAGDFSVTRQRSLNISLIP